ncbi:MAG: DNA repair protein RecN [Bacteroidales bacterium]|nr:DNA repair protein RecN [Bacteroidales bacterium]
MLANLFVKNYALIESLEIAFPGGFSIITGETGAGKSILMGALSLILGQRADTNVLKHKNDKCIVEGVFRISESFRQLLEDHDLDYESRSLFRREIAPNGKSRSFINDTPVTLQVMKEIGTKLVDIHSQHQNLQLNDQLYQLEVVDFVAGSAGLLADYRSYYVPFIKKQQELQETREAYNRLKEDMDYLKFQFEELQNATLKPGEMDQLESELKTLEHSEEIKSGLSRSARLLNDEGTGANELLKEVVLLQQRLAEIFPPSAEMASRFESAYIELKDLHAEIERQSEKIDLNPERLSQVQERIDLLYRLMQKHRLRNPEELLAVRDATEQKLAEITLSDERIKKLGDELAGLKEKIVEKGEALHQLRMNTGNHIRNEIVNQLIQLGIPNARFEVRVEKTEHFDRNGMSRVNFMFSANKQVPLEEISRVASGGEVSRLMLSIKSLISNHKDLPTLIFDEIDAGVSGEIADRVGSIMELLASGRQVIAVTHLPQVACKGAEQFLVYKEDTEEATYTRIRKLNRAERIVEIARMLSGEEVTDAAISNAKELLKA